MEAFGWIDGLISGQVNGRVPPRRSGPQLIKFSTYCLGGYRQRFLCRVCIPASDYRILRSDHSGGKSRAWE